MRKNYGGLIGLAVLAVLLCAGARGVAADAGAAVETGLVQETAELFVKGGSLMWVLLLASVVGLTFTLERVFSLRTRQHLPLELEERLNWLLDNEGVEAGREYLQKNRTSLARCLNAALGHCDGSRRAMEQALEDELARILWDERRNIRPVGMVATVAPLLGLLGTVVGMIDAFRSAAESGMDNPALFAGGIYMALYTTAFGLLVAIPFLLLYHWLRGRVEQMLRRVEDRTLIYIQTIECEDAAGQEAA